MVDDDFVDEVLKELATSSEADELIVAEAEAEVVDIDEEIVVELEEVVVVLDVVFFDVVVEVVFPTAGGGGGGVEVAEVVVDFEVVVLVDCVDAEVVNILFGHNNESKAPSKSFPSNDDEGTSMPWHAKFTS